VKVFMSLDLEGATGVFSENQTQPGRSAYKEGCALLLGDLTAAVEGCRAAGVDDLLVADGHHAGHNLSIQDVPDGIVLRSGFPGPYSWISGVGPGFDAAVFVAYHAKAGTQGAILDHTYQDGVYSVELEGVGEVGEFGLAAAACGAFGIPVLFASGDECLAAEAEATVPGIRTVTVKRGLSTSSGQLSTRGQTAPLIRDGVHKALSTQPWPAPLDWSGRDLRIRFTTSEHCDKAKACPGVERQAGRSVVIPAQGFLDLFSSFLACMDLASIANEVL
jgi:D-amino peptidase